RVAAHARSLGRIRRRLPHAHGQRARAARPVEERNEPLELQEQAFELDQEVDVQVGEIRNERRQVITGLLLFEDSGWRTLRPLTDPLPAPALAFGGSALGARWVGVAGVPLAGVVARPEPLEAWDGLPNTAGSMQAEVLVANAAALPGEWLEAVRGARGPGVWL